MGIKVYAVVESDIDGNFEVNVYDSFDEADEVAYALYQQHLQECVFDKEKQPQCKRGSGAYHYYDWSVEVMPSIYHKRTNDNQ